MDFLYGMLVGLIIGQLSVWYYIKRKAKDGPARILQEGDEFVYIEKRKLPPIETARFSAEDKAALTGTKNKE
jgi:hypothetical protein